MACPPVIVDSSHPGSKKMMDADFPEELCLFIQKTIPTIDAAELLVFLARDAARHWKFEEIAHDLRPTEIAESEIRRCLALFLANGLRG